MSNLTPKEKALELIMHFSVLIPFYSTKDNLKKSKQCANVCVNEILIIMNEEYLSGAKKINYWQEVKKEIELL